jgi:hypothetical protein
VEGRRGRRVPHGLAQQRQMAAAWRRLLRAVFMNKDPLPPTTEQRLVETLEEIATA